MHIPRPATAATAVVVAVLSLLTLPAGTARAHGGTLAVHIGGHEHGRVTARITWENDEDSVGDRVAATVNAVSADGARTAGPWLLVRDPSDERRFTTVEALPAGRWKVAVEVGHPALGRDEADITVAAAPEPRTPSAPPADPSPATSAPHPPTGRATARSTETSADAEAPSALPGAGAAAGGVVLVGGAAVLLAARNRRRGGI
ncbi:hypothetical protein [Streptomyces sp. NPDC053755]|uniref:hypothetical protein n=1 Tax=Streptomyces sp. NPDC053755 TaxID=3155815 RepID=UPI00341CDA2D